MRDSVELPRAPLYAQSHNGIDNIIVVLPQSFDGLFTRHACLSHDQLDILIFQARLIDFLAVVFILFLLVPSINCLALVTMIVACVCIFTASSIRDLLCRRGLSLRVEVLDLGFTEDASRRLAV
jgi:hypothetical protein